MCLSTLVKAYGNLKLQNITVFWWLNNTYLNNQIYFVSALAIPFKLTVVTNTDEQFTTGATQGVDNNEALTTPLGTQGFSLTYDQRACPGN